MRDIEEGSCYEMEYTEEDYISVTSLDRHGEAVVGTDRDKDNVLHGPETFLLRRTSSSSNSSSSSSESFHTAGNESSTKSSSIEDNTFRISLWDPFPTKKGESSQENNETQSEDESSVVSALMVAAEHAIPSCLGMKSHHSADGEADHDTKEGTGDGLGVSPSDSGTSSSPSLKQKKEDPPGREDPPISSAIPGKNQSTFETILKPLVSRSEPAGQPKIVRPLAMKLPLSSRELSSLTAEALPSNKYIAEIENQDLKSIPTDPSMTSTIESEGEISTKDTIIFEVCAISLAENEMKVKKKKKKSSGGKKKHGPQLAPNDETLANYIATDMTGLRDEEPAKDGYLQSDKYQSRRNRRLNALRNFRNGSKSLDKISPGRLSTTFFGRPKKEAKFDEGKPSYPEPPCDGKDHPRSTKKKETTLKTQAHFPEIETKAKSGQTPQQKTSELTTNLTDENDEPLQAMSSEKSNSAPTTRHEKKEFRQEESSSSPKKQKQVFEDVNEGQKAQTWAKPLPLRASTAFSEILPISLKNKRSMSNDSRDYDGKQQLVSTVGTPSLQSPIDVTENDPTWSMSVATTVFSESALKCEPPSPVKAATLFFESLGDKFDPLALTSSRKQKVQSDKKSRVQDGDRQTINNAVQHKALASESSFATDELDTTNHTRSVKRSTTNKVAKQDSRAVSSKSATSVGCETTNSMKPGASLKRLSSGVSIKSQDRVEKLNSKLKEYIEKEKKAKTASDAKSQTMSTVSSFQPGSQIELNVSGSQPDVRTRETNSQAETAGQPTSFFVDSIDQSELVGVRKELSAAHDVIRQQAYQIEELKRTVVKKSMEKGNQTVDPIDAQIELERVKQEATQLRVNRAWDEWQWRKQTSENAASYQRGVQEWQNRYTNVLQTHKNELDQWKQRAKRSQNDLLKAQQEIERLQDMLGLQGVGSENVAKVGNSISSDAHGKIDPFNVLGSKPKRYPSKNYKGIELNSDDSIGKDSRKGKRRFGWGKRLVV